MSQAKARFAIDLDEIERQLAQPRQPAPANADPLAELARLVGQDDPFRASSQGQPAAIRTERRPTADERRAEDLDLGLDDAYAQAHGRVASAEAGGHGWNDAATDQRDPADEPAADLYSLPRRSRMRKGAVAIGGLLVVSAVAATGAFMMRSGATGTAGDPPLVQAANEPLKVQPQNPGGIEIPNQNKEIYERAQASAKTRIVNREEQPLDVREAARAMAGNGLVPPATATAAPAQSPTMTAALGEPRRVRTVAVKPDGTIVPQAGSPGQAAASAAAPPAPAAPRAALQPVQAAVAPTTPAAPQSGQATALRPAAVPAPTRVASTAPLAPAASGDFASGTYAVQIAVSATEKDARAAFQGLQQKFAGDLGGKSPVIRSAEVNGKTVFRVRLGPMSKDDAGSLCTRLKGNGGACFVARN